MLELLAFFLSVLNILFVLKVDFISGRKQTRVESLDKDNLKIPE